MLGEQCALFPPLYVHCFFGQKISLYSPHLSSIMLESIYAKYSPIIVHPLFSLLAFMPLYFLPPPAFLAFYARKRKKHKGSRFHDLLAKTHKSQ